MTLWGREEEGRCYVILLAGAVKEGSNFPVDQSLKLPISQ